MAKSCNQKSKILYLERLFMESSAEKPLSMQTILSFLEEKEIKAERKSIYDDMETLRSFGMNIQYRRGKQGGYYMASCDMPKLPQMQQKEDLIPEGVKQKEDQMPEGEMDIEEPAVIPEEVQVCEKTPVQEKKPLSFLIENPKQGGKQVKLLFSKSVREDVIKILGTEVNYKGKGENGFSVAIQVEESAQFYGWLASFGKNVHILKPKKAAIAYREYLKSIIKDYKGIEK